jgi:hypothetical protein
MPLAEYFEPSSVIEEARLARLLDKVPFSSHALFAFRVADSQTATSESKFSLQATSSGSLSSADFLLFSVESFFEDPDVLPGFLLFGASDFAAREDEPSAAGVDFLEVLLVKFPAKESVCPGRLDMLDVPELLSTGHELVQFRYSLVRSSGVP